MALNSPVDVVVVGCGAVSQMLYAPALTVLQRAGDVLVKGLVDPAVGQRTKMAVRFPHATLYDDLTECPLTPNTLVIVATPPRLHASQTIYALREGASVLCEKPMAASIADAEAMLKADQESQGLLAVGIFRRFFPAMEALKSIFENQPLGALQQFSIQEGGKFLWDAASDSFFRRDMTMGGVFFDLGVYVVDMLLWLMGEPASFTYADDAMGGVEANSMLKLTYANNVGGTVRMSRDWKTRNQYVFRFEAGVVTCHSGDANHLSLSFDDVPYSFFSQLGERTNSVNAFSRSIPTRTNAQSFTAQLQNVVAAMRGVEHLRVSGEDAIRSLRFIHRCYQSRGLMSMPWMTTAERDAAVAMMRS